MSLSVSIFTARILRIALGEGKQDFLTVAVLSEAVSFCFATRFSSSPGRLF
jgi:hypothetical protein